MARRQIGWVVAGLLVIAVPAWPDAAGDAGLPGAFLSYGAGARALGMGRAFTGLADDATAVYWNAAGLTGVKKNQAIVQYSSLIDQSTNQYLGYAHIFPYIGTAGVGLVWFNQGTAEGRDELNAPSADFTNSQLALLLGFGTDVTSELALGGTLKLVNQTMANLSGTGYGLDLSAMYRPWTFLGVGLNLQNLVAPSITLRETADQYPQVFTLGLASRLFSDRLRLDLDLAKNSYQNAMKVRAGVEFSPLARLFLRGGLDDTEIDLGAGYSYQDFQLDYALGFQTVEVMNKISLSYSFGGYNLEVKADPPSFSPVGINKVGVIKIDCQTKTPIRVWNLEILNEANMLVKKYSGEGEPPHHVVWSGIQPDDNNPMPDGRYKINFSIEGADGEKRNAPEAYINIQSLLPLGVSPVELVE